MPKLVAPLKEIQSTETTPSIVVLGGSLRGLSSVRKFFAAVRANAEFRFILVLKREGEAQPDDVLSSLSLGMPAMLARRLERLAPGRVYVLPARTRAGWRDGKLESIAVRAGVEDAAAIDLSLRALADELGPSLAAVLLPGVGDDGAAGIRRVREQGGLTIVQSEATPPSALDDGSFDWVLSPREMPARLVEYRRRQVSLGRLFSTRSEIDAKRDEAPWRELLGFVRCAGAHDFSRYDRALAERRVARRMQLVGVDDLASYLACLRMNRGEIGALVQDLLGSASAFFRDGTGSRLGAAIARSFDGKERSASVRVWVAGCATGEEAYSMAMMLFEHAQSLPSAPSFQIFATDIHERALATSRAGIYSDSIAADVTPALLAKYFVKTHRGYRVNRELRDAVIFAEHDVLADPPFSRLDIVSCRNLLGALNPAARRHTLKTFHFALRGGGLLLLDSHESLGDDAPFFERVHEVPGLYAAVPGQRPIPIMPFSSAERPRERTSWIRKNSASSAHFTDPVTGPQPAQTPRRALQELHARLIGRGAPPSVLVDAELEIRSATPSVSRFLSKDAAGAHGNLLAAIHPMLHEYQASTEELAACNEELQALNEELETSREALQSTNEELQTLNQDLKSKIDEVIRSNSDLNNFIAASAIATLFLNLNLRINRFTPSAAPLFNLIPSDVGRPLADLKHCLDYPGLIRDVCQVLDRGLSIEREIAGAGGRFFLARFLPYRTEQHCVDGAVLTFVDITERHLAVGAARKAHEELESRVRERTAELDAANDALRKEALEHQRAERARQELQRRLISAQEDERTRISRELHDEVGQQLTAVMLSLKALEAEVQGKGAAEKLRALRATTQRAAQELHQLATELRPSVLDDLGLGRALATYVEAWSARTGIAVDLICEGLEQHRLPQPIETTLYRIMQEAMNNVYKHARAENVTVSIERDGDRVLGSIEDDGVGFDARSVDASTDGARLGVAGLRERAAIVGGTLTIDSIPGGGTTVRVKIPLS